MNLSPKKYLGSTLIMKYVLSTDYYYYSEYNKHYYGIIEVIIKKSNIRKLIDILLYVKNSFIYQ